MKAIVAFYAQNVDIRIPVIVVPACLTTERFWNCAIIDILINNNDRNTGNWGLLYEDKKYRLAPVFDNGAAFSNKYRDDKIREILGDEERMRDSSLKISTIYGNEDKTLFARDLLRIDNKDLCNALKRNVSLIRKKMPEIRSFIMNIPEKYQGISVCSRERKEFYIKGMEFREAQLLEPALELQLQHENNIMPER